MSEETNGKQLSPHIHTFKPGEVAYYLYCGTDLYWGVVVKAVDHNDGHLPGYILRRLAGGTAEEWHSEYGLMTLEDATAWRLRNEGG